MASVTSTYARAFADVVIAKHLDPAATVSETQLLASLVNDSKPLREVWENPAIPAAQKRAVLDAIVKRLGISVPVRNFVAVIIDHGRTNLIAELASRFAQELNERLGFAEAEITAVRDLSPDERQNLEKDLARVTGKSIRARYTQDLAILGGVVARVGSTVYDGSVRGQLERLREQLAQG